MYPAGQSRSVDPAGQSRSGMDWMRSIPTEEVVLGRSPFILNQGPGTGTSPFHTKPGTRPFILNQLIDTWTIPIILN